MPSQNVSTHVPSHHAQHTSGGDTCRVYHTEEFAAFVGIDWADAKHDVCLQAVGSDTREFSQLEHTPEAIDAWARALQERFAGRPVAVGLELNKGPLVYALRTIRIPGPVPRQSC